MAGDLRLDLGDTGERLVPTRLQFTGDQTVGRIGGIVLAEGAIRRIARRFEIASERLANLIALLAYFRFCSNSRRDHSRLDDLENGRLDRVIDPQAAERDAARLTIVEQTSMTGVARDVVLHAGVTDRQLPAAAPAAHQARKQRVAMLGRAMMTARRHVVAHHPANRLCPLPVDIAFMGAGRQRQPLAARLAAALHLGARTIMARRGASLTIRIGTAVDRIVDHPVDGGIAGPAPGDIAVVAPCGQIKPVFVEPKEGLARTAQFRNLVEDKRDRFLYPSVGVLLQSITNL